MADVPFFLFKKHRKGSPEQKAFIVQTRADIRAVIDLLSKRGMWSKYHTERWIAELNVCNDEEVLHLWWDAIVGGAMFETDSPKMAALEEYTEEIAEGMEEEAEKYDDDMQGESCGMADGKDGKPDGKMSGPKKKMMKVAAASVFAKS